MVQKKGKRTFVTTMSLLAVLLIAIGTVALIRAMASNDNDPYKQNVSNSAETTTRSETTAPTETTGEVSSTPASEGENDDAASSLDPSTVGTVDISPMGIKVAYVKGVGGFEYEVLRAGNGTRYVELRSPTLAGTKCTNDIGTFASILTDPTDNETATVAKTITVEETRYGLSLADDTCTSDPETLAEYQKSFSDAFSLLEKLD